VTRVVGLNGGIGTGKSTVGRLLAALGAVVIDSDAIVRELQAPGTPLLARIVESFGGEMLRPDGSLDRARLGQLVFTDPAARKRLNDLVHPAVGVEMVRRLEAAQAAGAALVVLDIPLLLEGRAARASAARSEPEANGVTTASAARSEPKANGVTTASAARSEPASLARSEGEARAESRQRANGVTTAGEPGRARTASDLVSEVIVVYAPEAAQIERQVSRDGAAREHAAERVRAQLSIEEKRKLADHVIDNSGALSDTERQVRELFALLAAG